MKRKNEKVYEKINKKRIKKMKLSNQIDVSYTNATT